MSHQGRKCQFRTYQVRKENIMGRNAYTDRSNVAIKWLETGKMWYMPHTQEGRYTTV
jgi:hypothetical protein